MSSLAEAKKALQFNKEFTGLVDILKGIAASQFQALMRKKQKFEKLLAKNEECTKRVAKAVAGGDEEMLMGAIIDGERTLEEMGVVSRIGKKIARKVEESGGAAKILGGGGMKGPVGMMLIYGVEARRLNLGGMIEKVQFETEGVRLEA